MKQISLLVFFLTLTFPLRALGDDITDAFNSLYSNNKWASIFEGVQGKTGGNLLIIWVNKGWNSLSQSAKKEFVENAVKVWAGMHGARGLDANLGKLTVLVKTKGMDPSSIDNVAMWTETWGASVK